MGKLDVKGSELRNTISDFQLGIIGKGQQSKDNAIDKKNRINPTEFRGEG